jgi:lipoate-protein ligase A
MICEIESPVSARSVDFEETFFAEIRQEPAQPGQILMEQDAELLKQAANHEQGAVLRFYEWICPTVSLGFHQSEQILDLEVLQGAGVPWVRRPTGGAAVLHSEELTYSLILPPEHPIQRSGSALEYVGKALVRGLSAFGVNAQIIERGHPLEGLPDKASCFVRASRWEVCARGKKIVGSAQRVLNGALLQHGSILCGPDHLRLASFLRMSSEKLRESLLSRLKAGSTSVAEELGEELDMSQLRQQMAEAFQEEFAEFCHA